MRKSVRLASNYLINMNLTHPLTLSRTCKALAVIEVHTLHAFGELELVDSTCGWECGVRENDQMRNEETRAAGLKLFNKYDHHLS